MNLIKNLIKNLAISIINTALTVFICYWNIMAIINAFQTPNADWNQVWTYLVCSVVILVIMWISAFLKFLKRLAFVILVLLLVGWFSLPQLLPNVTNNMCVTMGSCKAGSEVTTAVSGKFVINKQTCLQNKWKWDDKKQVCKTK